ncbi:hypothetical protein Tco_0269498 [Tanacetum coccineum]
MTLNDFRRIFHLPQATDNNHEQFVIAPKYSKMVPFFLNTLVFTLELRSPSNFKTMALVEPWRTLGKIFARCLTTRVTGHDQPPLQIMQIKARDKYHNLEDDAMVKNIFNSGKHKDDVGIKIPSWMITNEMKLTDHYRMTTSAPRTPNPDVAKRESSASRKSTVIRLFEEHLIAEEIEKLVEGSKNVENVEFDSSTLRQNDNTVDPVIRLKPRIDKERSEVELTAIEQESAEDDYEYLCEHLKTRSMPRKMFNVLAQNLQEVMEESLPKMVDDRVKELTKTQVPECENLRSEISSQINDAISNHILSQDDLPIWFALKYNFERFHVATTPCRPSAVRPRDQDDPHDDAHPQGGNDTKRQKTSEHETFVTGESSSGQDYESEPGPSMSVPQELVDEMSQTVDEAKLRKVADEMLRQQCTLGDEHQYHIDQMQNFLKNDIIVLEGLKSYNNDVRYGYVTTSLNKDDAEYLQLFGEEIEE